VSWLDLFCKTIFSSYSDGSWIPALNICIDEWEPLCTSFLLFIFLSFSFTSASFPLSVYLILFFPSLFLPLYLKFYRPKSVFIYFCPSSSVLYSFLFISQVFLFRFLLFLHIFPFPFSFRRRLCYATFFRLYLPLSFYFSVSSFSSSSSSALQPGVGFGLPHIFLGFRNNDCFTGWAC
jgi:hypothetical protein